MLKNKKGDFIKDSDKEIIVSNIVEMIKTYRKK